MKPPSILCTIKGRVVHEETAMKRMILSFFLLIYANVASAETPFQFAAPNHQSPQDPDVNGVRFSIFHGKNQSVRGLDLGLLSLSETSNLSGLALVLGMGKVTGEMPVAQPSASSMSTPAGIRA